MNDHYYVAYDEGRWRLHRPDGRPCADLETRCRYDFGSVMREAADLLGIDNESEVRIGPPAGG